MPYAIRTCTLALLLLVLAACSRVSESDNMPVSPPDSVAPQQAAPDSGAAAARVNGKPMPQSRPPPEAVDLGDPPRISED